MSGTAEGEPSRGLQPALAAEHAAVYGYGVVGAVLSDAADDGGGRTGLPGEGAALAGYAEHRARRDRLIAMIGADAVAAEPAYALPFPVTTSARARRLAAGIEQRCAGVYADVVSETTDAERSFAAQALTEAAVRSLTWGAQPEAFPGLGEL